MGRKKHVKSKNKMTREILKMSASLMKKMIEDDCEFSWPNKEQYLSIFEPDDFYSKLKSNQYLLHMIYRYLSRNDVLHALTLFIYALKSKLKCTWLWRVGFHILQRIGHSKLLHDFYEGVLTYGPLELSGIIYEYFLYLLQHGEYDKLINTFDRLPAKAKNDTYTHYEPNKVKLNVLHSLLVAVAHYQLWSQNYFRDGDRRADESERYFFKITTLIEAGEIIDTYVVIYVDLLKRKEKFKKALEVLDLYDEKCVNNHNAAEYRLRFVLDNIESIKDEIDCEDWNTKVKELMKEFLWKRRIISPVKYDDFNENSSDHFTETVLRRLATDILSGNDQSDLEDLAAVLFETLDNVGWIDVEWPWECLHDVVDRLGLENDLVLEKMQKFSYWSDFHLKQPDKKYLLKLRYLLFADGVK